MPDKTKDCRHCRESISEAASVCFHCRRSQGKWTARLESGAPLITVVPIILSIILVIFSWMQFLEAKEQRKSADKAVNEAKAATTTAQKASAKAEEAQGAAEQARDETRNTVENLRTNIKLLLEMEHLTPKLVLESYDPIKVGKVREKLEEFAVPDENERKAWLESLRKQMTK